MLAEVLQETTVSREHTHANAACARELGISVGRLRGALLETLMHLGDDVSTPLTYARLRACCRAGSVRDLKVNMICADGRKVEFSVNAGSLSAENGGSGEMVLIARNMTEITGLMQAAREGLRAQSDFAAMVGHEMRTPMHGVIATTSLMLAGKLDGEQREQLGVIQRSAETLVALVDDLLDYSKLDARRVRLDERVFSVRDLARDVVKLLEGKAREAGLLLEMRMDDAVAARLVGDPDRLRQVLVNLCGNAIKFTNHGGAQLRISAIPSEPRMQGLRVEVVDTGIGIPSSAKETMFEPFVRGEGLSRHRYGGTGLGLAISRHLVELMGSELQCESEPGHGSLFWFELDLPRGEAPGFVPPDPRKSRDFANLRVLVAEDHPTNRSLLLSMLDILGVEARAVEHGEAAVEAMATGNFDLALLDWEMPLLGGAGTAQAIRALGGKVSELPLICMTGRPDGSPQAAWRKVGMNDLLAKPFRLSQLNDILNRWLSGDHVSSSP
jgi:signal transduction histidine kinase